ncbi:MAG: hypothetical protein ACLVEV_04305 [Lachnospiraceae bacterium]
MGLSDMLGVRNEKLTFSRDIPTIDDLYDAIKDVAFEAGKPALAKEGFTKIIVFPEIDRNNQVQIMGSKGRYTVVRSVHPAGLGNMAKGMVLDKLTDGWSSISGSMGKKKKLCLELVTKTAQTIRQLQL